MKFKLSVLCVSLLIVSACTKSVKQEENLNDNLSGLYDLKVLDVKKPENTLSGDDLAFLQNEKAESKEYTGVPVSLSFFKADIHDFFRALSEVANVNFLIHEQVKGSVTIEVSDVRWDQLLDTVLEFNKLTSVKKGNIIEIIPREFADKITEIIKLNFATASELVKTIKGEQEGRVDGEKLNIVADQRTNSIIITEIPERITKLKAMIKRLDRAPRQVLLESLIVEVTLEDSNKLGIGWTFGEDGRIRNSFNNTSFESSGSVNYPLSDVSEGTGFNYFLSVNDNLLNAQLQAYAQARKAKILSHPKLVTFDNHEAKMTVVERRFVQTSLNANAAVGVGGLYSNFEERDYGIILSVTPHINESGDIVLKVSQNVSDLTGVDSNGNPISVQRTIDTTLLLRNAQTMVLGGLIQEKVKDDTRGLPWFYKIPFIKYLFGASEKLKSKVELLLFITPHLINNFEDAGYVTTTMKDQNKNLKPLE